MPHRQTRKAESDRVSSIRRPQAGQARNLPTAHTLRWGANQLHLGTRTCVMGILNITPDSFSDGGRFFSRDRAIDHGIQMADAGADILDVGGESTRPFSDGVSEDEETRRVVPVIAELAKRVAVPISIDTTKAAVARRAFEAGASILNDVSALRTDPQMAPLAARQQVPVVLMHMRGTPRNMQIDPVYDDLLGEVSAFLSKAASEAQAHGIVRERILIDPGIGFGKTLAHNLTLFRHLGVLARLGFPIVVGPSRKTFLRHLLKDAGSTDIRPDLPVVATGTQAAVAAAILNGAHVVRVHDVATTRATARIIDAIKNS